MKHYVYKLIDPRNGETFYIGKGTGDRMKRHTQLVKRKSERYKNRNPHRYNKIQSILESGYEDLEYEKPYEYEESEKAFDKEEELINEYGLENLVNICEGGKGGHNPEAARINSEIRSGSTWEEIYGKEQAERMKEEWSEKLSGEDSGVYGMSFEEIHGKEKAERLREKFAMNAKEQHTGKTRSKETREKIRQSQMGDKNNAKKEEVREKISETVSEIWDDPEYKEKMSEKLSKAQKKRWEREGKKLSKSQVREALEASTSIAEAKRYACREYEEVSRPTFDKYIKEYDLTQLKEQVKQ